MTLIKCHNAIERGDNEVRTVRGKGTEEARLRKMSIISSLPPTPDCVKYENPV
ncbi:hypothetical protein FHS61_002865 [Altererythrobacter atlanticus]|uniref:Uncharacterized protein n=1 Tax=Croceibacterium atlanticum TaxID=1267766 RepID=A0A0F7KWX6_9SPHN|nr:hypothetical protein WYH_02666 [Croceibacterium atlanticum]MBB5733819.1 hypothetical protein [Croceibacterium atlanticum]